MLKNITSISGLIRLALFAIIPIRTEFETLPYTDLAAMRKDREESKIARAKFEAYRNSEFEAYLNSEEGRQIGRAHV